MKDNHIPREVRIRNHIAKLNIQLYELEPKPYGGGNPYSYCASCSRSMIEASYAGHYKGCRMMGIKNEIKYWENQLGESIVV